MDDSQKGHDFSDAIQEHVNWDNLDLRRSRFCRASFLYCSFRGVNLTGADFSNAIVPHGDFTDAILRNVDFEDATIVYCDMREADLRDSCFNNVSMGYVKLQNADLRGADFSGTKHIKLARLQGARYDATTRWPPGFDPEEYGAIRIDSDTNEHIEEG